MTDKMKQILHNLHRYNMEHMANANFGLPEDVVFDALVIAPSYTPYKLIEDESFQITELESRGYCAGYVVEKDGLKIAWARTTTGACNMLDYLVLCGELQFKRLIFIGAVGALKADFDIGAVCTPSYSIAGTLANTYLKDSLRDYVPFEKVYPDEQYVNQVVSLAKEQGHHLRKASVFCTDSIAMEYSHLDEIKSFGTDLIEMETATFYAIAKLMEVPAIALLVVSDNSVTGVPLVGRTEEQQQKYHHAKKTVLVELIEQIARLNERKEAEEMDYKDYFNHLFPGFFERAYIRNLPPENVAEELVMDLHQFSVEDVPLTCPAHIRFGMFDGDIHALQEAVREVDESWVEYFKEGDHVYCAFDGDKVVSFCLVDEFGTYNGLKVGGPGCVGTIPSYRKQGIGLKMVQNATEILKKDGFDVSHIHYTAVGPWYAHLGYRPVLKWNCSGFIG